MRRVLIQSNLIIIIIVIISSLLLISCDDKKFTNPWDEKSNLNPDEWAPTNFRIEKASSDTILLAWDYEDKNIEGFQIDRQVNDAEWQLPYKILPKESRVFAETDISNNIGNTINYKIFAYAGNNISSSILVDFIVGVPTVTTNQIFRISDTSAISGGNVISDGGSPVITRGVCWSTNQNPTINNSHTIDGIGIGSYSSSLSGLITNTLYYVRAYVTNSVGVSYGSQISFKTLNVIIPTVATSAVTNITQTTAICGGNVTSDGGGTVKARGICWSTNQNPTIIDSHTTDGIGTGIFSSSITGLTVNTAYYVRAYATNTVGTAYG
jgi:hypothetical protein